MKQLCKDLNIIYGNIISIKTNLKKESLKLPNKDLIDIMLLDNDIPKHALAFIKARDLTLTLDGACKKYIDNLTYNGVLYTTVMEMCEAIGLDYTHLIQYKSNHKEQLKGKTNEEIINIIIDSKKRIEYNGRFYPSYKKLCEELQIDYNKVIKRRFKYKDRSVHFYLTGEDKYKGAREWLRG